VSRDPHRPEMTSQIGKTDGERATDGGVCVCELEEQTSDSQVQTFDRSDDMRRLYTSRKLNDNSSKTI